MVSKWVTREGRSGRARQSSRRGRAVSGPKGSGAARQREGCSRGPPSCSWRFPPAEVVRARAGPARAPRLSSRPKAPRSRQKTNALTCAGFAGSTSGIWAGSPRPSSPRRVEVSEAVFRPCPGIAEKAPGMSVAGSPRRGSWHSLSRVRRDAEWDRRKGAEAGACAVKRTAAGAATTARESRPPEEESPSRVLVTRTLVVEAESRHLDAAPAEPKGDVGGDVQRGTTLAVWTRRPVILPCGKGAPGERGRETAFLPLGEGPGKTSGRHRAFGSAEDARDRVAMTLTLSW